MRDNKIKGNEKLNIGLILLKLISSNELFFLSALNMRATQSAKNIEGATKLFPLPTADF